MSRYDYENAIDKLGMVGRWLMEEQEEQEETGSFWQYGCLKYIEFALKQAQADLDKLEYKDEARVIDSSDGKLSTRKN